MTTEGNHGRRYQILSLSDLANHAARDRSLVLSSTLSPARRVPVAPFLFGASQLHTLQDRGPSPDEHWACSEYWLPPLRLHRISGATCHTIGGVVTVGNYVLRESLEQVAEYRYTIDGQCLTLHSDRIARVPGRVLSALCGEGGNYYHSLLDSLGRICALGGYPDPLDGGVVMPGDAEAFTADLRSWAARTLTPVITVSERAAITCDELVWIPSLLGFGARPHVELNRLADRFLAESRPDPSSARRLYIARFDSQRRRLENERDVCALMDRHGYEIVTLRGRSVAEQARMFADASHIVAPHGAGLTNLIFCRPWTMVCEIVMDSYLSWTMARLANLRGCRYGCVVGRAGVPVDPAWPHTAGYVVDVDELHRVLRAHGFLDGR